MFDLSDIWNVTLVSIIICLSVICILLDKGSNEYLSVFTMSVFLFVFTFIKPFHQYIQVIENATIQLAFSERRLKCHYTLY